MDSLSAYTQYAIWRSETAAMMKEIIDMTGSLACGGASICFNRKYPYVKLRICLIMIQTKINLNSHKLSAMVYLLGNIDSDVNYESVIEGQNWNSDVRIICQSNSK